MYSSNNSHKKGFPDPLADYSVKQDKSYGLQYAKAMYSQWGQSTDTHSLYGRRNKIFSRSRDYANGTQDTTIYKQLLNSLSPEKGDGSLLNLDYTPVPILPKFVKIVLNKILSRDPYPNLESTDPISSSEKNKEKERIKMQVQARKELEALKEMTGVVLDMDPDSIPETLEEAEMFMDTNIKTDAEVAAQLATSLTLDWANFNDSTFRRAVMDIVSLGMAVVKRNNDPNKGIDIEYVDPSTFLHSYTEDPNFGDLVYAGHIKRIPIQELKRIAGDQLSEEDYKKIANKVKDKYSNDASRYNSSHYDDRYMRTIYGYDEYMVELLDFEGMYQPRPNMSCHTRTFC